MNKLEEKIDFQKIPEIIRGKFEERGELSVTIKTSSLEEKVFGEIFSFPEYYSPYSLSRPERISQEVKERHSNDILAIKAKSTREDDLIQFNLSPGMGLCLFMCLSVYRTHQQKMLDYDAKAQSGSVDGFLKLVASASIFKSLMEFLMSAVEEDEILLRAYLSKCILNMDEIINIDSEFSENCFCLVEAKS